MTKHDIRFNEPLYTVNEAARVIGMPASTLGSWTKGYVRNRGDRPHFLKRGADDFAFEPIDREERSQSRQDVGKGLDDIDAEQLVHFAVKTAHTAHAAHYGPHWRNACTCGNTSIIVLR